MKELSIETVDIEPWAPSVNMWFLCSYPNPPYHPTPPYHPNPPYHVTHQCHSPNPFKAHFESLVERAMTNDSSESEQMFLAAVTMVTCNQSDLKMLEIECGTSTDIDLTFFVFSTIIKKNVWTFPGNLAFLSWYSNLHKEQHPGNVANLA